MNELSNTENARRHKALLKFWTICVKIRQQLAISPAGKCLTAINPNIYSSLACGKMMPRLMKIKSPVQKSIQLKRFWATSDL